MLSALPNVDDVFNKLRAMIKPDICVGVFHAIAGEGMSDMQSERRDKDMRAATNTISETMKHLGLAPMGRNCPEADNA